MINKEWDFKHIVIYSKTLKKTYKDALASFSYFNKKDLIRFKRQVKQELYSVKARKWQIDRIWNYFNDLEPKPSIYYLKLSKLDKKKVK